MNGEERQFELAELRTAQERDAAIAEAISQVSRTGSDDCVDCGEPIPVDRKIAAPFARRCLDCQMFHEEEKLHR